MAEKPAYVFDLRDNIVPFALLKITHAFREMEAGESIRVKGSPPATRDEIFKILRPFKYDLIKTREKDGLYYLTIRKNPD